MMEEPLWYVVHTYSGYENKVKVNIEKLVENRNLQDQIVEIKVPMHDTIEIKDGKKQNVNRKVFPGYVLLKMIMNDETWYVVRNTRGVTSFVGPGSKPVPLSQEEVLSMGIESVEVYVDVEEGDEVSITTGPFEGSVGLIKEINYTKKTATVSLSVFGRDTSVEIDLSQIIKVA